MHGLACCHHGNILTLVYNNSSVYSPQHQSTIDTPLQPYTTVDNRINYYLPSVLEMQQYIDISPYHDTLGGDTVSIHI